jgi:hypothetical protein
MHALTWACTHAYVRVGVRLIQRSTFVQTSVLRVALLIYSAATTVPWGSISSVYPDSVNFKDILLIVPSS